MATLNEEKYSALLTVTGAKAPITINELECLWHELQGRTGTLNEMWYQVFEAGGFTGDWNDAACGWLASQGYTKGTINERWYKYWVGLPSLP
jgi:hypothetical protein